MTSSDCEQMKISIELKQISLKIQQLLERKKNLCIFQELRNRADFESTAEESISNQHEIESINEKIEQLSERMAELKKRQNDDTLYAKDKTHKKDDSFSSGKEPWPAVPVASPKVVFVDPPPSVPAPTVILDLENFPPCPCKTQCPQCQQFIVTETFSSVSSVTWLVCFTTAMIGCVAGCCFVPFCLDRFKSITHRCPKCRTSIHTIKKF